jgi:histidinol phosphatase-like PHP family hydrolase
VSIPPDIAHLFDHHVHTDRSDGTVSLEGRAESVRVRPHGVSDHFPWRDTLRTDDDVTRYLDDASRLGLRVGIEYDLGVAPELRPATRDSLHYVIGAIHQVELSPGEWVRYDEAGAFLKGRVRAFSQLDRFRDTTLQERIRERTLELVRQGIERDGIDILGHATMGPLGALADPEVGYPPEWQERLIRLCVAANVAIEVNETYGVPHRAFLERARALGARFAVGTDTHFELKPLDRTAAMIEAAGLAPERFLQGTRVRTVSDRGPG